MPVPRIYNPTGRKTPAHVVDVGVQTFYFSYQTCIGYAGPDARTKGRELVHVRVPNLWGSTTGRHFSEFGIKDWAEVTQDELAAIVGS